MRPGAAKHFAFRANAPGVFMYHCGTAPAFVHIANGMYGAIVVEPKSLPAAGREYVLVGCEFHLSSAGNTRPTTLDLTKALNMAPTG